MAESFMKTLKVEAVYLMEYETFDDGVNIENRLTAGCGERCGLCHHSANSRVNMCRI